MFVGKWMGLYPGGLKTGGWGGGGLKVGFYGSLPLCIGKSTIPEELVKNCTSIL